MKRPRHAERNSKRRDTDAYESFYGRRQVRNRAGLPRFDSYVKAEGCYVWETLSVKPDSLRRRDPRFEAPKATHAIRADCRAAAAKAQPHYSAKRHLQVCQGALRWPQGV